MIEVTIFQPITKIRPRDFPTSALARTIYIGLIKSVFSLFFGSSHTTQIKLYCILKVRLSSRIINGYYCCNLEADVSIFHMTVSNSLFNCHGNINIIIAITVKFSQIANNRFYERPKRSACHILIVEN